MAILFSPGQPVTSITDHCVKAVWKGPDEGADIRVVTRLQICSSVASGFAYLRFETDGVPLEHVGILGHCANGRDAAIRGWHRGHPYLQRSVPLVVSYWPGNELGDRRLSRPLGPTTSASILPGSTRRNVLEHRAVLATRRSRYRFQRCQ